MSEYSDTVKLANKVLDRPNADPDDDLATLSRQFLRQVETVERLKKYIAASSDPTLDLINANRDTILKMHEEAIRRIRPLMDSDDHGARRLAIRIIEALNAFHPMHSESWAGWPES
jgi:hypothetical protein